MHYGAGLKISYRMGDLPGSGWGCRAAGEGTSQNYQYHRRDDSELGARVERVFQLGVAIWLTILCLASLTVQWFDYLF